MRVPLELLRLILEWAERDYSLEHLFALRLVNRLFDNEVLYVLFETPKLHNVFRSISNSFHRLPVRLKYKYLYFRIDRHTRGHPSVFSTLFYRAYELQRCKFEHKREELVQEMVTSIDFEIFSNRYNDNQWCLFIQGPGMRHWLALYDRLYPNHYPDVNIALRLYLLLRAAEASSSGLGVRVTALIQQPVAPQYRLAFAHDVFKLVVHCGNTWIASMVYDQLGKDMRNLPLKPYIEMALRARSSDGRWNYYNNMADTLLHRLVGGQDYGLAETNRVLRILGTAIKVALDSNESAVSAIIIEQLRRCASIRGLHAVFHDVFGADYEYRNRRRYALDMSRMEVIQLDWERKIENVPQAVVVEDTKPRGGKEGWAPWRKEITKMARKNNSSVKRC